MGLQEVLELVVIGIFIIFVIRRIALKRATRTGPDAFDVYKGQMKELFAHLTVFFRKKDEVKLKVCPVCGKKDVLKRTEEDAELTVDGVVVTYKRSVYLCSNTGQSYETSVQKEKNDKRLLEAAKAAGVELVISNEEIDLNKIDDAILIPEDEQGVDNNLGETDSNPSAETTDFAKEPDD